MTFDFISGKKCFIWDDGRIEIFREMESNFKIALKELGVDADITRSLDYKNSIYFILNPHHKTFNKRHSSNTYIGWDLTNSDSLFNFEKMFRGRDLDVIIADIPEKVSILKEVGAAKNYACLEPVTGFYSAQPSDIVGDRIGFIGGVTGSPMRIRVLDRMRTIYGDRFAIIDKYGSEKISDLRRCKYLVGIQRFDYYFQIPNHLRISLCLSLDILPLFVKNREEHDYAVMIDETDPDKIVESIVGEISALDSDPKAFKSKLGTIQSNYARVGIFKNNLSKVLEEIDSYLV